MLLTEPFNVTEFGLSTDELPVTTVATVLTPLPLAITLIVTGAPPPLTGMLPL